MVKPEFKDILYLHAQQGKKYKNIKDTVSKSFTSALLAVTALLKNVSINKRLKMQQQQLFMIII